MNDDDSPCREASSISLFVSKLCESVLCLPCLLVVQPLYHKSLLQQKTSLLVIAFVLELFFYRLKCVCCNQHHFLLFFLFPCENATAPITRKNSIEHNWLLQKQKIIFNGQPIEEIVESKLAGIKLQIRKIKVTSNFRCQIQILGWGVKILLLCIIGRQGFDGLLTHCT